MLTKKRRFAVLIRCGVLAVTLGAVSLAAAASRAQEVGRCVRVEVVAPIVLPDGSEHPAGSLEVCVSRIYSPVACLHEARVNGRSVGTYISRSAHNEMRGARQEPFFVFHRTSGGKLVLQGYAVPEGTRMRAFLMTDPVPREGRL